MGIIVSKRFFYAAFLIGLGVTRLALPQLKKFIYTFRLKVQTSKVPIRKISRGDIITLEDNSVFKYDGFYQGYYLFVPINVQFEDYIRLKRHDLSNKVIKIENNYGIIWLKKEDVDLYNIPDESFI